MQGRAAQKYRNALSVAFRESSKPNQPTQGLMSFIFVFVPVNGDIEEREASKAGGLEADELKSSATAYFTKFNEGGVTNSTEMTTAVRQQLVSVAKISEDQISSDMIDRFVGQTSVEIIPITVSSSFS
jgi:hypothetical protein